MNYYFDKNGKLWWGEWPVKEKKKDKNKKEK